MMSMESAVEKKYEIHNKPNARFFYHAIKTLREFASLALEFNIDPKEVDIVDTDTGEVFEIEFDFGIKIYKMCRECIGEISF